MGKMIYELCRLRSHLASLQAALWRSRVHPISGGRGSVVWIQGHKETDPDDKLFVMLFQGLLCLFLDSR